LYGSRSAVTGVASTGAASIPAVVVVSGGLVVVVVGACVVVVVAWDAVVVVAGSSDGAVVSDVPLEHAADTTPIAIAARNRYQS